MVKKDRGWVFVKEKYDESDVENNIGICKCLNTLDKNLFIMSLEENIERTKARIEEIEKAPDSRFARYVDPEGTRTDIINLYKQSLPDMEKVLKRLDKIPLCD